MSTQNSLQVSSGEAIEVTHTPAATKKCSTKSMLLLGAGTVFIAVGIALGAYHAGTDSQKSAANTALNDAMEKIDGLFGGDDEQQEAVVPSEKGAFELGDGTVTTETEVTLGVDLDTTASAAKSGKSASTKSNTKSPTASSSSSKSAKKSSLFTSKSSKSDGGTASPTTDILSGKSGKMGSGSSKSSKSGGTSSPTTDILSGKSGKAGVAKSSKSGVIVTSSPSTDGLVTSAPSDSLPAGGVGFGVVGGASGGSLATPFGVIKIEEEELPEIAFMSLAQAEFSMSM